MVAASQPLAAQVGIDILKKGGNAVDAAIAVNAALGLMEPIGLGHRRRPVRHRLGRQSRKALRPERQRPGARRPSRSTISAKKGIERMPETGPLPWTVPGCVDGWFALHERFGRLRMKDVLEPAIAYAEEGFPLSE